MPTPDKVRAARKFLKENGLIGKGISPRLLAGGAEDLEKGFAETLAVLADLMDEGQGQGPSPDTQDLA